MRRADMQSVVSDKGQVTIPKLLRDRLGIRAGETLQFREENGQLIASKALAQDPVGAVYGILELGQTTDEFVRALRGDGNSV
jgi:AbrB family looped-hinge helix DNA binding protein